MIIIFQHVTGIVSEDFQNPDHNLLTVFMTPVYLLYDAESAVDSGRFFICNRCVM